MLAGTETSAALLDWVILYLILHPDMQERLYAEVREVTGDNSRQVGLEDREAAHYVNAFIDEVSRHSPMLLLPAGRKTLSDTTIRGVRIPKGTQVLSLVFAINRDPSVFDCPEEFRPDRNLHRDDDGRLVYRRDDRLYLFGVGKRRCPGEQLARAELFLFIARIVQKFRYIKVSHQHAE